MPSLPPSILDRRPITCGSACLMVALPPAGDIGGQDGGKSAFDAALPRSGHGAPLWGGILHRTTAGRCAGLDARSQSLPWRVGSASSWLVGPCGSVWRAVLPQFGE